MNNFANSCHAQKTIEETKQIKIHVFQTRQTHLFCRKLRLTLINVVVIGSPIIKYAFETQRRFNEHTRSLDLCGLCNFIAIFLSLSIFFSLFFLYICKRAHECEDISFLLWSNKTFARDSSSQSYVVKVK